MSPFKLPSSTAQSGTGWARTYTLSIVIAPSPLSPYFFFFFLRRNAACCTQSRKVTPDVTNKFDAITTGLFLNVLNGWWTGNAEGGKKRKFGWKKKSKRPGDWYTNVGMRPWGSLSLILFPFHCLPSSSFSLSFYSSPTQRGRDGDRLCRRLLVYRCEPSGSFIGCHRLAAAIAFASRSLARKSY